MKKIIQTLILAFICFQAYPQQYGNEWINYGQQYYRIFITQDGIYRIDSIALANAGINVGLLDPRKIQIFGRDPVQNVFKEQHIFVQGENSGVFKGNDYIEFYAMHNDGWYDAKLYSNPADQPNPNYSMFNDTATYYLTINSSINNLRMKPGHGTNFSSYLIPPYFNCVTRQDYTDVYFFGQTYTGDMTDPTYVSSEGWFDKGFALNEVDPSGYPLPLQINKTIPYPNAYTSGNTNTFIDYKLIGASDYAAFQTNHHVKITLNTTGTVLHNENHNGYYVKHYFDTIATSTIGTPSSLSLTFSVVNDLGSLDNPDFNTVAFINAKYPHLFNLGGAGSFLMYIPTGTQAYSYLNFSNIFLGTSDTVIFYDLTNNKRCIAQQFGSNYRVLDTNVTSITEKKCYIASAGQINHVQSLIPVSYNPINYAKFRNYTATSVQNSNYLIITHASLMDNAKAYGGYRASVPGGSFDTLVVDINDLYDQFCYGIRKDPVAIKNFAHYAYDRFNSVKDLFLIGKGLRAAESYASQCYRKSASIYAQTLIPGFGIPGSDILFTTFGSDYKQYIPTGRLAAKIPDDVALYLNKTEEYEQQQSDAQSGLHPETQTWMKNVLHFGGGSDLSEQNQLKTYLDIYKDTIQNPYFGGFVRTFLKSSTDPIQQNLSDSLKAIINNGVSIMTFFGHAAGIGFDISTDYPSAYNNQGKYPLLIANSCLAGDLFNFVQTSSEAFVLIANKGVIGYLASVAKGEAGSLDEYTTHLYANIGRRNYGQSIGKCIQSTIDTLQTIFPPANNFLPKLVCIEMTLHGDPAVKVNYFNKADYTISSPDIYFTPANVTAQMNTFTINFISTNIGRAFPAADSFYVNIQRKFPDNSPQWDTLIHVRATLYKDTFKLNLPVNLAHGIGLNQFTVSLNYINPTLIPEITYANNSATTTLLITTDDIIPVYPYKYAIVPSLNVTLKASTGNPFAPAKNYVFQVDTTDAFNSPVMISHKINHSGGVVTWAPVLPVTKDSIVYFWRVSLDSAYYHKYNWHESSFQYITGKRGWSQAHFYQFNNDTYRYITYNKPARRFDFVNSIVSIIAQTGFYTNNSNYNWTEEWYKMNGASMAYSNCMINSPVTDALKIAVFDSISCQPWWSPFLGYPYTDHTYGNYHCQESYSTPCFDFPFYTSHDRSMVRKFLHLIPLKDYVLVMTHESPHYSLWNDSLFAAFDSIGSGLTPATPLSMGDNTPYIIIGQKGAPSGTVPDLVFPNGQLHQVHRDINTRWTDGDITSELIGPAASWDSIHWRVRSIDHTLTDSVKLMVYGVKIDGTQVLLKTLRPVHGELEYNIRNVVDSTLYPYLSLDVAMNDTTYHTPSQMRRWQVTYRPKPETALDPSLHYSFYKDTLNEGDSIRFSVAIHNISEYNMDSLLVHYWIVDVNRHIHPVYYHRYRPHPAGDVLIDTIKYSTKGLPGLNSLWIEVNPNNDQLEQYHFNNIGAVYFYVRSDKINPLLDVTFDGVHILNDDIVSAKPLIEISLKDENKFLLMNNATDTSLFNVFIQNPNATTAHRIPFTQQSTGQEIMRFYPTATTNNNKCRIEYPAVFPVDGIYKLIVQAKDKSSNKSGQNDYEINFEVINKSTITEVMNYPNPFSTSTRFVFTLTGSVTPTYFKIQIMTITGKVVREIGMEDLGPIHIGRNITQYAWNGKDDFGDQLANGVYLYRVVSNINGKTIDKNPTGADQYFKHEFGKMVLIR